MKTKITIEKSEPKPVTSWKDLTPGTFFTFSGFPEAIYFRCTDNEGLPSMVSIDASRIFRNGDESISVFPLSEAVFKR